MVSPTHDDTWIFNFDFEPNYLEDKSPNQYPPCTARGTLGFGLGRLGTGQSISVGISTEEQQLSMYSNVNLTQGMSFSCWVKPSISKPSNNSNIFHFGDQTPTTKNIFNLYQSSSGANKYGFGHSSTSYYVGDIVNKWTHFYISADRNGNVCKMYVNGLLIASKIDATTFFATNTTGLVHIGGKQKDFSYSSFFKGSFDDFQLFNNVHPPEDIRAIFVDKYNESRILQRLNFADGLVANGTISGDCVDTTRSKY